MSGFDLDLFARYRAAQGHERTRLEGQLVWANEGLTKVLVAQLCGRGENRPGRRAVFGKQFGAEHLDPDEALAHGRLGMLKAIRDYKPNKAGFAYYAAIKLRYEIQEAAKKVPHVSCPRDTTEEQGRPRGFEFVDGAEGAPIFEQHEGLGAYKHLWTEEEKVERVRPTSAIAHFIEKRCEFRPLFRSLRERIFGAYERHARSLGFPVAPRQLERALLTRGARVDHGTLPGGEQGTFLAGVRIMTIRESAHRTIVAVPST